MRASPKGRAAPIDPKSDLPENQTPAQVRFKKDERALKAFANTVKLADVTAEDFDTVFLPAGMARCGTRDRRGSIATAREQADVQRWMV